MLDVGWSELLVIAIVLIVVVGPKDLPPMIRAFGKMTSRLRLMAGEFRSQFDEALKEVELDDVRKTISDAQKLNPANALRDAMNPLRQMGQEIRSDLQKATSISRPADVQPLMTETPAVASPELPAAETTPASAAGPADPHTALVPAPSVAVTKTRAPRKPKVTPSETAGVAASDVAATVVATPKARAPRKAKASDGVTTTVSAPVSPPVTATPAKPRKAKAAPVEGKQPAARKKRLLDETKKDEA